MMKNKKKIAINWLQNDYDHGVIKGKKGNTTVGYEDGYEGDFMTLNRMAILSSFIKNNFHLEHMHRTAARAGKAYLIKQAKRTWLV